MIDRENVIKRIDELLAEADDDDFMVLAVFDALEVLKDARELLNDTTEWNPINPDRRMTANAFECNKCKRNVYFGTYQRECDYDYCPWCGRRTAG